MVHTYDKEMRPLYCAWCGKERAEVRKLVAAARAVDIFICDECIQKCWESIKIPDEPLDGAKK